MMDGKPSQPVEFTRVLHVPSLQNNLLSCFYLARHKHIIIHIDSEQMDFSLYGKSPFCASIHPDNCTVLSGSSEALSDSANWVFTLPLTPSLWHRRCCHHNLVYITKMQKDALVTSMTFASFQEPDIVCKPCLAGKMHCNLFPSSPLRSTKPPKLSNLHGPLPVATCEGYCYWITFLDDVTSYWAEMCLKQKSQALEAFKLFKAAAKNQLDAKIKEPIWSEDEDEGGE